MKTSCATVLILIAVGTLACRDLENEKRSAEFQQIRQELAQVPAPVSASHPDEWQVVAGRDGTLFVLNPSGPYLFKTERNRDGELRYTVVSTKTMAGDGSSKTTRLWRLAVDSHGNPYLFDARSGFMFECVSDPSGAITLRPVSTFRAQIEAVVGESLTERESKNAK